MIAYKNLSKYPVCARFCQVIVRAICVFVMCGKFLCVKCSIWIHMNVFVGFIWIIYAFNQAKDDVFGWTWCENKL